MGFSMSTPGSSTNTVVTIKKINRMKTMSIMGEMLISLSFPPSDNGLRPFIL